MTCLSFSDIGEGASPEGGGDIGSGAGVGAGTGTGSGTGNGSVAGTGSGTGDGFGAGVGTGSGVGAGNGASLGAGSNVGEGEEEGAGAGAGAGLGAKNGAGAGAVTGAVEAETLIAVPDLVLGSTVTVKISPVFFMAIASPVLGFTCITVADSAGACAVSCEDVAVGWPCLARRSASACDWSSVMSNPATGLDWTVVVYLLVSGKERSLIFCPERMLSKILWLVLDMVSMSAGVKLFGSALAKKLYTTGLTLSNLTASANGMFKI